MTSIRLRLTLGTAMILLGSSPVVTDAKEIVIAVPNIPGPYCAYGAVKRLLELKGVETATTLWEREQIRVIANDSARLSTEDIKQAMKRADYPYKYEIRMGGDK